MNRDLKTILWFATGKTNHVSETATPLVVGIYYWHAGILMKKNKVDQRIKKFFATSHYDKSP